MASLRAMNKPGILALFVGFVCKALAGVLIGALVSGVCGAKYIEKGKLTEKDDFEQDVKDESVQGMSTGVCQAVRRRMRVWL